MQDELEERLEKRELEAEQLDEELEQLEEEAPKRGRPKKQKPVVPMWTEEALEEPTQGEEPVVEEENETQPLPKINISNLVKPIDKQNNDATRFVNTTGATKTFRPVVAGYNRTAHKSVAKPPKTDNPNIFHIDKRKGVGSVDKTTFRQ